MLSLFAEERRIKVSPKSMWLPFQGCTIDFIRDVCHARCCDAPTRPLGMLVAILPEEEKQIEAQGGHVIDGILQPKPGSKGCPFKSQETFLCDLHTSGLKPHGCSASPFMLNKRDTLIIRNRYKLLPCYKAKMEPAYKAFASSLAIAIGDAAADKLTALLDKGETRSFGLWVPQDRFDKLKARETIHHAYLS